jgi:hypothetical protein
VFRYVSISVLSAAAVMTLNAGQIQLSGTGVTNNNIAGFGLTGNTFIASPGQYIQPNPPSGCAGLQFNANSCVQANAGTSVNPVVQKGNYISQLFALATGLSTPMPDAATGTPNANGKINSGFVGSDGNPIQIDLMNAPNSSNGYNGSATCANCIDANFWRSTNNSTGVFDVPVGLQNVDSVVTMLNDYWGVNNAINLTVSFCFTATSNGSCAPSDLLNVPLTSGVEIRSSVLCNAGLGGCPSGTNAGLIGRTLAASTANVGGSGVNVNTSTVYSATYNSIPTLVPTGAANPSPFAGSNGGSVVLDAQQFIFSSSVYSGKFLSYIEFSDPNAGSWSATNTGASRYALSAITADVLTPEPSTVFLFLSGFGAIGLSKLRRRN